MANCSGEEDMACYFDGLLPEGEARQLERHLLGCDRCREIAEVTRKIKDQEKGLNDANKVV